MGKGDKCHPLLVSYLKSITKNERRIALFENKANCASLNAILKAN